MASKGQSGMLLSYVIAHTRTSSKKCLLLGEKSSMYLKVPQEARFFREEKRETFAPKAIIADYRAREDEESRERNAIRNSLSKKWGCIRPITYRECRRLNEAIDEALQLGTGVSRGMQLFML